MSQRPVARGDITRAAQFLCFSEPEGGFGEPSLVKIEQTQLMAQPNGFCDLLPGRSKPEGAAVDLRLQDGDSETPAYGNGLAELTERCCVVNRAGEQGGRGEAVVFDRVAVGELFADANRCNAGRQRPPNRALATCEQAERHDGQGTDRADRKHGRESAPHRPAHRVGSPIKRTKLRYPSR